MWTDCVPFLRAPVGRQRGGKQLRGWRDVVVVGAAYRLAARGGRGRGLHADLLQALVLQDTHTNRKNAHRAIRKTGSQTVISLPETKTKIRLQPERWQTRSPPRAVAQRNVHTFSSRTTARALNNPVRPSWYVSRGLKYEGSC